MFTWQLSAALALIALNVAGRRGAGSGFWTEVSSHPAILLVVALALLFFSIPLLILGLAVLAAARAGTSAPFLKGTLPLVTTPLRLTADGGGGAANSFLPRLGAVAVLAGGCGVATTCAGALFHGFAAGAPLGVPSSLLGLCSLPAFLLLAHHFLFRLPLLARASAERLLSPRRLILDALFVAIILLTRLEVTGRLLLPAGFAFPAAVSWSGADQYPGAGLARLWRYRASLNWFDLDPFSPLGAGLSPREPPDGTDLATFWAPLFALMALAAFLITWAHRGGDLRAFRRARLWRRWRWWDASSPASRLALAIVETALLFGLVMALAVIAEPATLYRVDPRISAPRYAAFILAVAARTISCVALWWLARNWCVMLLGRNVARDLAAALRARLSRPGSPAAAAAPPAPERT
ncbi:MAG: hypothetical protein HY719_05585 [Planctomycetes bacterium]|nr:hypothetical protein [Planctomycetota bacterium]